jgi:hypothetical protein
VLAAHAAGIYCLEAAIRLLIGHRRWLERGDFLAECVEVEPAGGGKLAAAWVEWEAVAAALDAGQLACSSGERQVLHLALGLAAGVPVDLREALGCVDAATSALVAEVVLHAAGHRRAVVALDGRAAR